MRKNKGFTIVEVLTVVSILGFLVLLTIPKFINYIDKADNSAMYADLRTVQNSLDIKITNEGISPYNLEKGDTQKMDLKDLQPEYLNQIKKRDGYDYWVDAWDIVYYSNINPPENVKIEDGKLTWNAVKNAESYNIYQIKEKNKVSLLKYLGLKVVSANSREDLTVEKELYKNTKDLSISVPEGEYIVSSVNKTSESPAVNFNYKQNSSENIKDEENKNDWSGIESDSKVSLIDEIIIGKDNSFEFKNTDWTYSGTNKKIITENGEFLTSGKGNGGYSYVLPKTTKKATIQVDVKNLLNKSTSTSDSSIFVRTGDLGVHVYFYPDKIKVLSGVYTKELETISMDMTHYRTVRIVKDGNKGTVYIDGEKVSEQTLVSGSGYSQNRLFFGDGSPGSSADHETYFKNITVVPDDAVYINK